MKSTTTRPDYTIRCKCCGKPGTITVKLLGVCSTCLKAAATARKVWHGR